MKECNEIAIKKRHLDHQKRNRERKMPLCRNYDYNYYILMNKIIATIIFC